MQACTGLAPAQLDTWLPVFSHISGARQQQPSEAGGASGTRRRKPGGGPTGTWPPMPEQLLVVLSYDQPSATCAVLGTQCARARAKAHANLPTLSPLLSETRVAFARRPSREVRTPHDGKAAWPGLAPRSLDAPARA
jgi:hypothetical protein